MSPSRPAAPAVERSASAAGPHPGRTRRARPPMTPAARRALPALLALAVLRALGWILLAESLARLITGLAMTLDPEDSARLLELLFHPPAPVGPVPAAQTLSGPVLLGAAGVALRALAEAGQRVVGRRAALGAQQQVRAAVVAQRLAAADGGRPRSGADAVLVTHGLKSLDDHYTEALPALAATAVVPAALGVWILTHDLVSAVVAAITLPLVPLFMILVGRHTQERIDAAQDGLDRLAGHLLELARGLPVLVGLHRAGVQRRALQEVSQRHHAATMVTLRTAFLSGLALELIASLSVAVMAVFIGLRLVNGQMALLDGLVVLILAAEVYLPLREVGAAYHASEDGREAESRARAAADAPVPAPVLETLAPASGPDRDGGVVIRDLSVRLAGRQVLGGLDLSALPGRLTALAGPSGTGKSTVLRLLAGLLRQDAAEATGRVAGVDTERTLWIGQHPVLTERTVAGELDLAAGGALPGPVRSAVLAAVALEGLQERDPADLSPGERRRVAVARLLARLHAADGTGPWLVLLDEPTAHLDGAVAAVVVETLAALPSGAVPGLSTPQCTVLAASHDPTLLTAADAIVRLAPGAGPTAGSPATAMPVAAAQGRARPEPATPRRASLRVGLRLLPWRHRKLWAGIGWAAGTHVSAALLAALSGWLIVTASSRPPVLYLLAVIVLVRGFGLSRAVFRYLDRLVTHDAVFGWATELRLRLWDALGRQPRLWGRVGRTDGALSLLVSDVDAFRDAVPRVLVPAPAALLAWLATAALTQALAPELAVVALVPGAVALVAIPALVAVLDRRQTAAQVRGQGALVDRAAAVLNAAGDLRGLGLTEPALRGLAALDDRLQRPHRRAAWAAGGGRALAVAASGGIAVAVAAAAAHTGTSAPVAALVVLLALSWAEPYGALAAAAQHWGTLADRARATGELLGPEEGGAAAPPEPAEAAEPAATPEGRVCRLRLAEAAFAHPGAPPLWTDLELDLAPGDVAVVTGPSGSGKSTLLAVLLGFLPLTAGRYTLETVPPTPQPDPVRPDATALARVAWTPQDALIFDSTARGNLALARGVADAPSDAELTAALELVGLGPWLAAAPQGLDTRVGPGGQRLSGGQRQRLAVARALVARADVVLLDEPTAHVDADEARALITDLRRALTDRIVVIVTHDGRLLEDGDVPVRVGC
ncbi:thiol reductant ABC exporter subunit CydC [Micrococcus luteus]|nr:thiol reductant ABC exporter subunit CydC [Micrococcus luteus]